MAFYNYGSPNAPGVHLPPAGAPVVYDPQLGYVTEARLQKRDVRRDVNRLILTLLSFFVGSLLGGLVAGLLMFLDGGGFISSTEGYYALTMVINVICIPLPFLIYMAVRKINPIALLRFEKTGAGNGLLFIFAGFGLCLLMNFPISWISDILTGLGMPPMQVTTPPPVSGLSQVLLLVSTAVMPAIFEEFVFRGVILGSLKKYGEGFAIVFSAAAFGLLHLTATGTAFAFIAGLVMGYAYVRTGNLWVPIGIHFLNNGLSVFLEILNTNGSDAAILAGNIFFYFAIAAGIICTVLLAVKKRFHKKLAVPALPCLTVGQTVAASVSNPGCIIYVSVCLMAILAELFGVILL